MASFGALGGTQPIPPARVIEHDQYAVAASWQHFGRLAIVRTRPQGADLRLWRALGGTRTPNLLIRSQMLYPLSYERGSVRGPV